MRLWIDGQCLQTASNLRGIGRYVFELIRSISTHHPEVKLLVSFNAALPDAAIEARNQICELIPHENIFLWEGIAESGEIESNHSQNRKISELALSHHVACLRPDIALSASPFEGFSDVAVPFIAIHDYSIPTAAIFYDAIPYRFPDRYLTSIQHRNCYIRRLKELNNFDKLLTISHFSTKEANELLKPPTAEIDAGISPEFLELKNKPLDKELLNKLNIHNDYMLYVGAMDWRKNITNVINSFTHLPQKIQSTLLFVIAGDAPEALKIQLKSTWKKLALPQDNLIILGHVTDSTLVTLYKQAKLVIQPSLMEGFGLTALEAMVCAVPVIAANAGALPEVIGNELALFNPEDPIDIAKVIHRTIENNKISTSIIETGEIQSKKYTWKRTADLVISALTTLIKDKNKDFINNSHSDVTIDSTRRITALKAIEYQFDTNLSAHILAAAEPLTGTPCLLVDVTSTAIHDHATGIQRVVKNISTSLLNQEEKHSTTNIKLGFCDSNEGFFQANVNSIGKIYFDRKEKRHPIRFSPKGHLLMLDSSWEYHTSHVHIFRQARLARNEVTSVLYDLVPLQVPAFCHAGMPPIFSAWLKGALARSTGFLCISKAVADDLIKLLHAIKFPKPLNIGYWHLGADLPSPSAGQDNAIKEYGVPMFLMVGTLEPRKGYGIALEAFSQLWENGFDGHLYLAGKRGWGIDHLINTIARHPENGRKLHWIEGPRDEELLSLYKSCDALVAASYAEGFGLPIVEASLHQRPIIASDIPVFREVAGQSSATIFFETGSSNSLVNAIKEFTKNKDVFKSKAKTNNSWLTWDESAIKLKNILTNRDWQYRYLPSENSSTQMSGSIGILETTKELNNEESKFELKLIEEPILSEDRSHLKFIIRITNNSDTYWSSDGINGHYAIKLGYHIVGSNNNTIQYDNPRISFPMGIPPHTDHYTSLEIGTGWLLKGMKSIEFELVQEGVRWWGHPLLIHIKTEI